MDVQLAQTDISRASQAAVPDFAGGGRKTLGRSDFEGRGLNDLVSMVEGAKPADLEAAADALWAAADDIKDISTDLDKHVKSVEWEGTSAKAFRAWTRNLARNTLLLSSYTETASTQLKAAAVGLASVRSGMPPKDAAESLGLGVSLSEVPSPARVEGNPAFDAASKKEADRQEAINQMNRLSSYYQVSHDIMAAQQQPTFGPMPDVGVPEP
ncbi:hypothetical protein QNO07_27485, partial [Streptomyces sp. 549]|nr:hypothetical protein [Streptomyces sp. 549]